MSRYVPKKSEVEASQIIDLAVTTIAKFADGTSVIVPNSALVGDFIEMNPDQTVALIRQDDFLAQYQPA